MLFRESQHHQKGALTVPQLPWVTLNTALTWKKTLVLPVCLQHIQTYPQDTASDVPIRLEVGGVWYSLALHPHDTYGLDRCAKRK